MEYPQEVHIALLQDYRQRYRRALYKTKPWADADPGMAFKLAAARVRAEIVREWSESRGVAAGCWADTALTEHFGWWQCELELEDQMAGAYRDASA